MKTQYKRFDSSTQVDEWYASYKKFFPSEDDEDKDFLETINFYTGNANVPINRYLRTGKNMQELEYFYKIYQNLCERVPSYQIPDNVIVYRYISKNVLRHICPSYPPKKGMILEDKGFLSTTLLRESIRDFVRARSDLNVLLEISIPKGTNGIYVGHLECTEDEYEVILPPKTKLRIDNKIPIFNTYFQCTVIC